MKLSRTTLELGCKKSVMIMALCLASQYEAGRVVKVYRKNRGNSSLCRHSKHTRVLADY